MNAATSDVQPPPIPRGKFSYSHLLTYGYFIVVFGMIFCNFLFRYHLVQLDARVHRLMTSTPTITIDQVRAGLSDIVKNESNDPSALLDFGNPDRRVLYIDYDHTSGVVKSWMMVQVSDPIDTAKAADGTTTRALLRIHGILALIAGSPLVFLSLQPRAKRQLVKATLRIAYVILMVPSVAVALFTGLVIAVHLAGF